MGKVVKSGKTGQIVVTAVKVDKSGKNWYNLAKVVKVAKYFSIGKVLNFGVKQNPIKFAPKFRSVFAFATPKISTFAPKFQCVYSEI